MERNEILEQLSDKIRKGEPVSFIEAIACINYQQAWQAHRKANTRWERLKRWVRNLKH